MPKIFILSGAAKLFATGGVVETPANAVIPAVHVFGYAAAADELASGSTKLIGF